MFPKVIETSECRPLVLFQILGVVKLRLLHLALEQLGKEVVIDGSLTSPRIFHEKLRTEKGGDENVKPKNLC